MTQACLRGKPCLMDRRHADRPMEAEGLVFESRRAHLFFLPILAHIPFPRHAAALHRSRWHSIIFGIRNGINHGTNAGHDSSGVRHEYLSPENDCHQHEMVARPCSAVSRSAGGSSTLRALFNRCAHLPGTEERRASGALFRAAAAALLDFDLYRNRNLTRSCWKSWSWPSSRSTTSGFLIFDPHDPSLLRFVQRNSQEGICVGHDLHMYNCASSRACCHPRTA